MYIVAVWLIDIVFFCRTVVSKGKGKALPLQACSVPQCCRNLRFPDFMTTVQDGGKVVNLTHRPLFTPRKYS